MVLFAVRQPYFCVLGCKKPPVACLCSGCRGCIVWGVDYAYLFPVFKCNRDAFIWTVGIVFVLVFWWLGHGNVASPSYPVPFFFVGLPVWFSWVPFVVVAYEVGRVVATVDGVETHDRCYLVSSCLDGGVGLIVAC